MSISVNFALVIVVDTGTFFNHNKIYVVVSVPKNYSHYRHQVMYHPSSYLDGQVLVGRKRLSMTEPFPRTRKGRKKNATPLNVTQFGGPGSGGVTRERGGGVKGGKGKGARE